MSDNSLEKYEGGFFKKIKRIMKNIFYRKKREENIIDKKEEKIIQPQINTIHTIKTESQKNAIKEDIIDLVEKKSEILKTLPRKRLEELEKLYSEKIEKNAREIE